MVLETAQQGKARYIISGDNDLLVLGQFVGIAIENPADFLERAV
jgi:predicted nucleic acid-binding protein